MIHGRLFLFINKIIDASQSIESVYSLIIENINIGINKKQLKMDLNTNWNGIDYLWND